MKTAGGRTFVDRGSGQEYQVQDAPYEETSGGETRRIRALVFTNAAGEWKWAAVHDSVELSELSDWELEELLAQAR